MQGKVIDFYSRNFTQANICIDYNKFLRLLNAICSVFILHAPLHVLMYTYMNVFQQHVTLLAIYILGTVLRAAFGRTSSAILVCAIYLLFHWQWWVMSINIFLCTLRLLYMYNIQVRLK